MGESGRGDGERAAHCQRARPAGAPKFGSARYATWTSAPSQREGCEPGTRMAKRETAAILSAVFAALFGASASAQEDESANTKARPETATSICLMAEAAASANGLPFEFFARLIWQES